MKRSLLLLMLGLVVSGCCSGVYCECAIPTISITYRSDSLDCAENLSELLSVSAHNASGTLVTENAIYLSSDCTLSVAYEEDRYWVVTSDSLNISDTIKVESVNFREEDDDDCCSCEPDISYIVLDVNGAEFRDTNIDLEY